MPTCTGCTVTMFGSGVPYISSLSPIRNLSILGDGAGAFSGITGFPLGDLAVFVTDKQNGECSGYTGIVTTGAGPITWNPTGYACTGATDCRTTLFFKFTPNPILSGVVPGYVFYFQVYDTEGRSFISQKMDSTVSSVSSTTTTHYQPCGYSDTSWITTRFFLPPYSGYVVNTTAVPIQCQTCITG